MAKPVKKPAPEQEPIQTFGLERIATKPLPNQLMWDCAAFALQWPEKEGALSRYKHFKRICNMRGLKIDWNPWLERQIATLCEQKWVCWAGCASSGKTFASALYAVIWWLCAPEWSSVILTTTTKGMLRKRAWAVISELKRQLPSVGNFVDSRMVWQAYKGDDKLAISGIAVLDGAVSKAMAHIQGVHTRRQLVIIDEATDCPEAVFDVAANLFAGPREFQFLVIGNPASRFDPMGKFAEPEQGWSSVSVDSPSWWTRKQLDGKRGACFRFDADTSPNRNGEVRWPYLITPAQQTGLRNRYGESSPLYWKFARGFWAPDGQVKTVFSETLLASMQAMGTYTWDDDKTFNVAGFDPAFGGGDRPMLQFGKVGRVNGVLSLQFTDRVPISLNAASSNPIHYQLAETCRRECEARNIQPHQLAVDATGEGGGLCDIMGRTWANTFHRTEFGGSPSDMPVSLEDVRPCSEVYERKVVELWFSARELLQSGQLKGVDASMALEFCNRTFDDSKRKIALQPKKLMKEQYGRSPDIADAACLTIEAARQNGLVIRSVGRTAAGRQDWQEWAKDIDAANDEKCLLMEEAA